MLWGSQVFIVVSFPVSCFPTSQLPVNYCLGRNDVTRVPGKESCGVLGSIKLGGRIVVANLISRGRR